MFKEIVSESLHEVAENYKLVRIAFVTTILHTMISLITVANYFTNILVYRLGYGEEAGAWNQVLFSMGDLLTQGYVFELVALAFLFMIGRFFLYPVGIGMMISYLHKENFNEALWEGLRAFGPLAVINVAISMLTLSSNTIGTFMRIIAADIAGSFLIQAVMIMLGIIIITGTLLLPYAMYVPLIEGMENSAADTAQTALKTSAGLAIKNLGITFKFSLLSIALHLRIIINIAALIFIPGLLMYLALQFNLLDETNINYLLYGVGGVLLFAICYVNAIIDSFFITYWYKLYMRISR